MEKNSLIIAFAELIGIAKPMFCAPPLAATAVLIPITCPPMFNNGQPEFPGLIAASVWITFPSFSEELPIESDASI